MHDRKYIFICNTPQDTFRKYPNLQGPLATAKLNIITEILYIINFIP